MSLAWLHGGQGTGQSEVGTVWARSRLWEAGPLAPHPPAPFNSSSSKACFWSLGLMALAVGGHRTARLRRRVTISP